MLWLALTSAICAADPMTLGTDLYLQKGEKMIGAGLSENNQMILMFASEATGTWSIVKSQPDNTYCVVETGSNFRTLNS